MQCSAVHSVSTNINGKTTGRVDWSRQKSTNASLACAGNHVRRVAGDGVDSVVVSSLSLALGKPLLILSTHA